MSLTSGRGPFSGRRAGVFTEPVPDEVVYVEPFERRVRARSGGRTVVDSERVVLVHRPGTAPAYAFPLEDVTAVRSQPLPELPGYVQVAWGDVEEWHEEDEQVFMHPRNPYHRIDCLSTHRRLRVTVHDTVVVDTTDTVVVYETSLNPRLYVRTDHVRPGVLVASATTTYCPYKGTAHYWSAAIGETVVADVAFSYDDPHPESAAIAGLLSFEDSRAAVEAELPPPVELRNWRGGPRRY